MYLSKIILENFQAFDKGEFNLSPNLNVLVGVSNVGKSSIARALSLVLFNQWDKSWCRFGAKYCRITVQTSTGIEVVREKGDKVNRYIITFPDQPSQVYESFGTQVPEAIQQALKIQEVQVDSTDILNLNLAGQMDSLFLLSQTGSYRAKVLGKLSGATYLDFAIRELNKDKRQVTAEKNSKELELTDLQTQVEKLTAIEQYSNSISKIGEKLSSLSTMEARLGRIRSLFERVKVLKAAWTREKKIESLLSQVDISSLASLSVKVSNIKNARLLLNKLADLKDISEKQNKLQQVLSQIDKPNVESLFIKISRLKMLRDLSTRLLKNKNEFVNKTAELSSQEEKYKEISKEYSDMLSSAGVCPICGVATTVNA